ncbi:hypothetical protein WA158_008386 [Blastocystis sp. Blastoise]
MTDMILLSNSHFLTKHNYFIPQNTDYLVSNYETNLTLKAEFLEKTSLPVQEKEVYDVTLISQTSTVRLFYLAYLQGFWKGPMSIAVYMNKSEIAKFEAYRQTTEIFPRMKLTSLVVQDTSKEYPINKLRNIAIKHVETSHFWIADMDMWPTKHTYEALCNLRSSFLKDDFMAIIIPSFSFSANSGYLNCGGFKGCIDTVVPHIPRNKKELINCISEENCQTFRPETETHDYMFSHWFTLAETTQLTFLSCINELQEPYVVVKRSEYLPLFDERFIDYGFNKIQYIDHLRRIGFKFAVLSQQFAFDIPHPSSNYAKKWRLQWDTNNEVTMKVVYDLFKKELENSVNDTSITYICRKRRGYVPIRTISKGDSSVRTMNKQVRTTSSVTLSNPDSNNKLRKTNKIHTIDLRKFKKVSLNKKKKIIRYLKKVKPSASNVYKDTSITE